MDDPWGSPWTATDDDTKHHINPPSPAKSSLEPPPRAFLTSTSPNIPTFSTQSPWADDDDGFGDWASAEPSIATPGATSSSGWGGWLGAEASASTQQLTPTPRDEGFGKASPIAWPGNIATSPGLVALSRSRSHSLLRQPSPDPWRSHPSPHSERDRTLAPSPANHRDPSPLRLDTPKEDARPQNHEADTALSKPPQLTAPGLGVSLATEPSSEKINGVASPQDKEPRTENRKQEPAGNFEGAGDDTHSGEDDLGRDSLSRTSSFCTDESRNDEPQDSPLTPIDEEARIRPPFPPHRAPSKVQKLVVLYDGLAKSSGDDITHVRAASGQSSVPPAGVDGTNEDGTEGKFGDFEDGHADETAEAIEEPGFTKAVDASEAVETVGDVPQSPSPDTTPVPVPESLPHEQTPPRKTTTSSKQGPSTPTTPAKPAPSLLAQLTAQHGPIQFTVDLSKIDELFDSAAVDEKVSGDSNATDSYVPDHPLVDSFTSISERKTWYRISRQGSSRRHNTGDDDDYRRVTWAASAVQAETVKIVRRWMEEDSITGKSTLGGHAARGNMFGWDSTAEPVALQEVFGRKRGSDHAKPASTFVLPRPPLDTSAKISSPTQGSSGTSSPAPFFAWSTASPRSVSAPMPAANGLSKAKEIPGPTKDHGSNRTELKLDLGGKKRPPPLTRPFAVPSPIASLNTSSTVTAVNDAPEDEDDDDWGEMVSSPPDNTQQFAFNGSLGSAISPVPSLPAQLARSMNGTPTSPYSNDASGKPQSFQNVPALVAATVRPRTAGSITPMATNKSALANNGPQTAGLSRDPWSSADFSIFDTVGSQNRATPLSPLVATQAIATPKVDTPPKPPTQVPLDSVSPEEEAAVKCIIDSLPDLSYMAL